MDRNLLIPFMAICLILWGQTTRAQTADTHNLWIMWEHLQENEETSRFRSHLMLNVPQTHAQTFFENLAPSARTYGAANVEHETSPICLAEEEPEPSLPTMIDTTNLEIADKLTTLSGLNGVFLDFRAARGPRTFARDFGAEVHGYAVNALLEAGIPLLTKEELQTTPGRPTLTLRYSAEISGCRPWSVSLSLKQRSALTRDLTIILEGTTWSSAARQSEDDVDFGVLDAFRQVIAAFTSDYAKANSILDTQAVVQLPAN